MSRNVFVEVGESLIIGVDSGTIFEDISEISRRCTEGKAFVEVSESLIMVDDC